MTRNILVVEDRIDTLNLINDSLRSRGFTVISATSGKEVLAKIEKTNIDLILLDMMMPGMSGKDVLKKIRSNKKYDGVKIIILTAAKYNESDKRQFIKAGAQAFLSKPIAMDQLRQEIDRILG